VRLYCDAAVDTGTGRSHLMQGGMTLTFEWVALLDMSLSVFGV
jgi:hypothetical protein